MEILYIVLAIIMLLIVFVITYNIWDNRRIKVTKITKKIKLKDEKGICGELIICHISDFHDCNTYGKDDKIIKILEKNKPDLIFCTGDFMDFRKNNLELSISFMRKLTNIINSDKIYYVSGNHEARMKMCSDKKKNEMIRKFWEELDILGINHLRDEKDEIEVNGIKLRIMGVRDFQEDYPKYIQKGTKYEHLIGNDKRHLLIIMLAKDRYRELNAKILKESLEKIENPKDENIVLLLSHRPEFVPEYGEERKYRFCIYRTCTWWSV